MINNEIAVKVFKAAESLKGDKIFDKLGELKKNQTMVESQVHDLSLEKLKNIVSYAVKYSPFYRQQFIDSDIPEINSFDDIKKIKFLTKEDLRKHIKLITSDKPVSKTSKAKTSGSTGIPLIFPKDSISLSYHYAAMYRGHSWYGLGIGDREARLWGVPVNKMDRAKVAVKDYLLNRFREKEYNLTEEVLDDFYCKLNKYQPQYVMGYGKMLTEFGYYLKETGRKLENLNLKMVKYTSENMDMEGRGVVEETFCCPVVSEYGAAETGIISFQCPVGSHHIMSDCVHVEYLDIDGANNDYKEIVVTDLNNYSFPIIRYRIGDLVVPTNKKCSCGLPFPLIEKVQGRVSETFSIDGKKKYHSIIFYYIMKGLSDRNKGLIQFRVIQKARKIFCYQLIGNNTGSEIKKYLESKTKQELGDDISVEIEYVEVLPREKSGKLRDFIPFRGEK